MLANLRATTLPSSVTLRLQNAWMGVASLTARPEMKDTYVQVQSLTIKFEMQRQRFYKRGGNVLTVYLVRHWYVIVPLHACVRRDVNFLYVILRNFQAEPSVSFFRQPSEKSDVR